VGLSGKDGGMLRARQVRVTWEEGGGADGLWFVCCWK
jgi:hypothetical protein